MAAGREAVPEQPSFAKALCPQAPCTSPPCHQYTQKEGRAGPRVPGKEEPKRRSARPSAKLPAKVETKPKKAAGKEKSSDQKKVQTKGKRGAKGKQAEVANQETKDLPAENGETKNEESPASDEAGEKEKSD